MGMKAEAAIARWLESVDPKKVRVTVWEAPRAVLFTCKDLNAADKLCRAVWAGECPLSVEIWVNRGELFYRHDRRQGEK